MGVVGGSAGGVGGGAGGVGGVEGEVVTVLMTAPDEGVAEGVVGRLVEERLAACGNIVPGAASIYRWKGEVRRDEEAVVILKTTRGLLSAMLARAEELHPYDVPELLAHEVAGGAAAYLDWVRGECGPGVEGGA